MSITTEPAEEFIALVDTDAFNDFWEVNQESLGSVGIDRDTAFQLACNCELIVGGGAAPLFRVGFVDEEC